MKDTSKAPKTTAGRRTRWRGSAFVVVLWAIIGFSQNLLLAPLTVLIALKQGFSWRIAVCVPLALVADLSFHWMSRRRNMRFALYGVRELKAKFPSLKFTNVALTDYLAALRERVPQFKEAPDNQILPPDCFKTPQHIRLVLLTDDSTAKRYPAQFSTYSTLNGSWILIREHPSNLTDLRHFILLHEIGHTRVMSVTARMQAQTETVKLLMPISLVALALWSQHALTILAISGVFGWLMGAILDRDRMISDAIIEDEIMADYFALERADPTWFQPFDTRELAEKICSAGDIEESAWTHRVLTRSEWLANNIYSISKGHGLYPRAMVEPPHWKQVARAISLAVFLAAASSSFPYIKWKHVGVFAAVTILSYLVAFVIASSWRIAASAIDVMLDIPISDAEENALLNTMRTYQKYQRFRPGG